MSPAEYWQEAAETALDEMGLYRFVEEMAPDQRADLGRALAGSHEYYGMAFYSPPPSDRISEIEREWQAKLKRAEAEFEAYRDGSEAAIKRAYRINSDTKVTIDKDGSVYRHGGRTEQIA